jgi:crossover junction endodeoxyribonuclease RuvC
MVILGIDPGTAAIGYGVVKMTDFKLRQRTRVKCLAYGLIETSRNYSFPVRLKIISREIRALIKNYRPSLIAIESVFFFKNLKTFIPVSRAEGVIILEAAKKNVPVIEFTPIQVKSIVANYGRAEKEVVQKRIKQILKLKEIPQPDDVADALGVALCGVFSIR